MVTTSSEWENFASESDIAVLSGAVDEADEFIRTSGNDDLAHQVEHVRNLISGFETPYGMELLATVHWVVTQEIKYSYSGRDHSCRSQLEC